MILLCPGEKQVYRPRLFPTLTVPHLVSSVVLINDDDDDDDDDNDAISVWQCTLTWHLSMSTSYVNENIISLVDV